MKLIILILIPFIWLNGFSQNLQSNPWRIDKIIGRDTSNVQEFTLQKIDTINKWWMWGNTIEFFPNGNFLCRYSAKCGNDCFPSSNGNYKLSDSTHITIFLKEYNQRGECENIHRITDDTIGTFVIVRKDKSNIRLIRQNE